LGPLKLLAHHAGTGCDSCEAISKGEACHSSQAKRSISK
jgi:hypothetical protein